MIEDRETTTGVCVSYLLASGEKIQRGVASARKDQIGYGVCRSDITTQRFTKQAKTWDEMQRKKTTEEQVVNRYRTGRRRGEEGRDSNKGKAEETGTRSILNWTSPLDGWR
jgi:hypothetical protein